MKVKNEYENFVSFCCTFVHYSGKEKNDCEKGNKNYILILKKKFTQADFMDDVKDVWKSSVKGVKNTFSVSLKNLKFNFIKYFFFSNFSLDFEI